MTTIKPIEDPFIIIKFIEKRTKKKRSIDLIRSGWLVIKKNRYYCKYPPKELYDMRDTWLEEGKEAEASWEIYPVEIISTAHSLSQGRRRLDRAFQSTDVNSTDSELPISSRLPRVLSKSEVRKELGKILPMTGHVAPVKQVEESRRVLRKIKKPPEYDTSSSDERYTPLSKTSSCEEDSSSEASTPKSKKSLKIKKHSRELKTKQRKDTNENPPRNPSTQLGNDEESSTEKDLLRKTPSVNNESNKKNPSSISPSILSEESIEHDKSKSNELDISKEAGDVTNESSGRTPLSGTSRGLFVNVNLVRSGSEGGESVTETKESDTDGSLIDASSHDKSKDKLKRKLFDTSINTDEELSPQIPKKKKLRRAISLEILNAIKDTVREEIRESVKYTISSIKIDLRNQTKDLKNSMMLNNARMSSGPPLSDLKDKLNVVIPIGSLDDFIEYDERLKIEAEEKNALVNYMRSKILSLNLNVKECIAAVLGSLITKKVQLKYTGFGTETKKNFSATQTFQLLQGAVAEKLGKEWDEKDFRYRYSKWFTGAGDREGGRKERQRKRRSKSA